MPSWKSNAMVLIVVLVAIVLSVFGLVGNGPLNQPPVAAFTASTLTPYPGRVVNFNAVDNYDPGYLTSYGWDFGDGTTGSGQTISHSWSLAGNYTVTLTVTDKNGSAGSTTQRVVVQ